MFDIKEFYPSIQEELLSKGSRFAQEYIDITSKDTQLFAMLVNHCFFMKRTHGWKSRVVCLTSQ